MKELAEEQYRELISSIKDLAEGIKKKCETKITIGDVEVITNEANFDKAVKTAKDLAFCQSNFYAERIKKFQGVG